MEGFKKFLKEGCPDNLKYGLYKIFIDPPEEKNCKYIFKKRIYKCEDVREKVDPSELKLFCYESNIQLNCYLNCHIIRVYTKFVFVGEVEFEIDKLISIDKPLSITYRDEQYLPKN